MSKSVTKWPTQFSARERVSLRTSGVSRTRQEFSADADINVIISKYRKANVPLPLPASPSPYLDVSEAPDLNGAFELAQRAQETFDALPSEFRESIGNDPRRLLSIDWSKLSPAQRSRLEAMGILKATPPPADPGSPQGAPPNSDTK